MEYLQQDERRSNAKAEEPGTGRFGFHLAHLLGPSRSTSVWPWYFLERELQGRL